MPFYVYILYSQSADKYYIGHSENPDRRLSYHNEQDKATFTTKYRPWEMKISFFAGNTRGEAMKVEKFIKKQKSRKFIEKIIASENDSEKLASLVRVPMCRD
jgi:putative endonuclease